MCIRNASALPIALIPFNVTGIKLLNVSLNNHSENMKSRITQTGPFSHITPPKTRVIRTVFLACT